MSKGRVLVAQSNSFFKNDPNDSIWWLDNSDESRGEFVFSFDGKTLFNLFRDYPNKLTPEQKSIFDKENPFWADYFSDRT